MDRNVLFTVKLRESLSGDRIILPQDVLEALMGGGKSSGDKWTSTPRPPLSQPQSSSPLVFRMRTVESPPSASERIAYGTVREFTAEPGVLECSSDLFNMLSSHPGACPTIQIEQFQLPKGTHVQLTPKRADYLQIQDLKYTLEDLLRRNYSTLSLGLVLTVSQYQQGHLVDHAFTITQLSPQDAVLCLDTEIEVDVVPASDEMAREALDGLSSSSSRKHELMAWNDAKTAQFYKLETNRLLIFGDVLFLKQEIKLPLPGDSAGSYLEIHLTMTQGNADIFISSVDEFPSKLHHAWYNVDEGDSILRLSLKDVLPSGQTREATIYYGIYGASQLDAQFELVAKECHSNSDSTISKLASSSTDHPTSDSIQCKNCFEYIPTDKAAMHEAFCFRNNTYCALCQKIFLKRDYAEHWHCEICDNKIGNSFSGKEQHMSLEHRQLHTCACGMALSLPEVAPHRSSRCPERLITCRFCHLVKKSGKMSTLAKDLYLGTGLCEHESECGARTIPCRQCKKSIQLKEVNLHMAYHDTMKATSAIKATITLCRNRNCCHLLSVSSQNVMKLCPNCFAPFYSPREDDQNKRLTKAIIETYHHQFTAGCQYPGCINKHCSSSKVDGPKAKAFPLPPQESAAYSFELFKKSFLYSPESPEYYFCISDITSSRNRASLDFLIDMGFGLDAAYEALKSVSFNLNSALLKLQSSSSD